jgi:hypothetical protein
MAALLIGTGSGECDRGDWERGVERERVRKDCEGDGRAVEWQRFLWVTRPVGVRAWELGVKRGIGSETGNGSGGSRRAGCVR